MTGPALPVTLQDIYRARQRIAGIALRTPLIDCPELSSGPGTAVRLKLENQQHTGAFKLRGAVNKLSSLADDERRRGVITVSTGNHGRAVAYAAHRLGVRAVICLSENVPTVKVDAIRRLGAEIAVHGQSYDEAMDYSFWLQAERGFTYMEPFDDPEIIAGQGTIGLELLEEMPDLDTAVVPLSGGGLISGIALALKSANPATRIIGVSMDRAPVMVHSLRAGRPVSLPEEPTLADALVGGIGEQNSHTFRMVQALVDETVLVTEQEIAAAITLAFRSWHQIVEGGGAVAVAALLHGHINNLGRRVAVVISGGNIDPDLLLRVTSQ